MSFNYDVIPPPTPISVFVLGNIYAYVSLFVQMISFILIPPLALKVYHSYKIYKSNTSKIQRNILTVVSLYFVMNVLAFISALIDDGIFIKNNQRCFDTPVLCTIPTTLQRLPQVFFQFFASSVGFLYVVRFYAFVENMIKMRPTKLELGIYFWYSIASVIIYVMLFCLAQFEVMKQTGMPVTQIYALVENIIFQILLSLMLYRLRFIHPDFLAHPMLIVFKESTSLIFILNLFRIGVQSALIYYGLGVVETILDAYFSVLTGCFNVIIEALIIWMMNLLSCRVGTYFDKGTGKSTNRTFDSTKRAHDDRERSKSSFGLSHMISKSHLSDNQTHSLNDSQAQIVEVYDGPENIN